VGAILVAVMLMPLVFFVLLLLLLWTIVVSIWMLLTRARESAA
jgi:hypothetical protein